MIVYLLEVGFWKGFQIANPSDNEELRRRNIKIGDGVNIGNLVKIGNGATISKKATIGNGVKIGEDATIGHGTTIGNWVNIGDCARIGSGVNLNTCVCIIGSKHRINYAGKGTVAIGRVMHPIVQWFRHSGFDFFSDYGYSEQQQYEYHRYVELIRDSYAENPKWEIGYTITTNA